MILHQQAPTPEECVKETCEGCKFFKRCQEVVKAKKINVNQIRAEIQQRDRDLASAARSHGDK